MALINAQTDVPGEGDTVVSLEFSRDREAVWVTFASGKVLRAHVDRLTPEERAQVSKDADSKCDGVCDE